MQTKLLKQLDRIKLLAMRQDKIVINSWDITYQENLKKYEKKTAKFVVEEDEEIMSGNQQNNSNTDVGKLALGLRKRRGTLERKKTEFSGKGG